MCSVPLVCEPFWEFRGHTTLFPFWFLSAPGLDGKAGGRSHLVILPVPGDETGKNPGPQKSGTELFYPLREFRILSPKLDLVG